MAQAKTVKRSIKQLQRIKTWQLVCLLILMVFVAATFLRLNNIGMVQRRDAVIDADKGGDAETITDRLYDLQRYAAAHMNAGTTLYLHDSYKRAVEETVDRAKQANKDGENFLAKADAICRPQFSGYSQAYTQCVHDAQEKFQPGSTKPITTVSLPSANLYRYSYISPLWSPDFAGFAVLVCLLITLMIVVRLLSLAVLMLLLKYHYRGI